MDEILDNIGPIAVGVIYLLGMLFSKKNKANEAASESLEDYDYEAAEEEYQRDMQSRNRTQPIKEKGRQNPPPHATADPNLYRHYQQSDNEGSSNFSWDKSDDSYDNEMEVQLKKIEATKREAARLQSQSAQNPIQAKRGIGNPQTTSRKSSFRSVRSSLKDPKAARSAFIYGEVLGPPVSLREGTGVPGMTS